MKLSELVAHQREWEGSRGIKNGNDGIDRIQNELDEAREAVDPEHRIWEIIDVLIISAGSIATLADKLSIPDEQVDKMIDQKLYINDRKYPVDRFQEMGTEDAIAYSRMVWEYLKFQWE